MAATRNSFVVAGRLDDQSGLFVDFDPGAACAGLGVDRALFRVLSEAEFRLDVSSSALRAAGQKVAMAAEAPRSSGDA